MKGSRRSAPTRTSSRRSLISTSKTVAHTGPSTAIKASARRIADKMQILALKRPNMLHVVETLLDGMLSEKRREDDRASLND
jgi:hypothetical protein